jgi:hypothetical protein
MNRQIHIKAKYRQEPDYRKLARALLSFVERMDSQPTVEPPAKPAAQPKPRKRAS